MLSTALRFPRQSPGAGPAQAPRRSFCEGQKAHALPRADRRKLPVPRHTSTASIRAFQAPSRTDCTSVSATTSIFRCPGGYPGQKGDLRGGAARAARTMGRRMPRAPAGSCRQKPRFPDAQHRDIRVVPVAIVRLPPGDTNLLLSGLSEGMFLWSGEPMACRVWQKDSLPSTRAEERASGNVCRTCRVGGEESFRIGSFRESGQET